ncbi:uncharacterized protein TNCV_3266161 [Trichonephila clavipes]|nr:uncharacterized protein TNCV_3266161 [Trichonephila clavipes]
MNHASSCGAMMAEFVTDAMLVNSAFQSALSNDIVDKHQELWFKVHFRNMNDPICYELRVILIVTVTSVKCYTPKSFPSFKDSLELYFSRIMYAYMLQRLFEFFVQPNTCNFFFDLLIRWMFCILSTCGIWLVGVSLVLRILYLEKTNFCCAYKQYGILFHKETLKICFTPCHVVYQRLLKRVVAKSITNY